MLVHLLHPTSSQRTKFGIGETGNLKYMSTSDDKGDSPLVCSNWEQYIGIYKFRPDVHSESLPNLSVLFTRKKTVLNANHSYLTYHV